jgi:hypothetical protein
MRVQQNKPKNHRHNKPDGSENRTRAGNPKPQVPCYCDLTASYPSERQRKHRSYQRKRQESKYAEHEAGYRERVEIRCPGWVLHPTATIRSDHWQWAYLCLPSK